MDFDASTFPAEPLCRLPRLSQLWTDFGRHGIEDFWPPGAGVGHNAILGIQTCGPGLHMAGRTRKRRSRGAHRAGASSAPRDRGAKSPDPDDATNITTLVLRAAFMDAAVYDVIRNQRGATLQAIGVVLAIGVLFAIGQRTVEPGLLKGQHPILWFVFRLDFIVIGWLLWSAIALLFGRWVFRGEASASHVLRALGIATAPASLLAFSELNIPLAGQTIGQALWLFGLLWTLAIGTQAIKETMRLNWFQAIVPGVVGWIVGWLVILNLVLFPASAIAVEDPPPAQDTPSASESSWGGWPVSSHLVLHHGAPPAEHGQGI